MQPTADHERTRLYAASISMDKVLMNLPEQLRQLGSATRPDGGWLDKHVATLRRPLDRRFYARLGRLDDLEALATSVHRSAPPVTGPKVLVGAVGCGRSTMPKSLFWLTL